MDEKEMDALLEVCAYDCRKGNPADHLYRIFEDRRLVQSTVTLGQLRNEIAASTAMTGKVIDQMGQTLVWRAHYWRHGTEIWEECASPEEAISLLCNGEEESTLSSIGVVWPDGGERPYDWVSDPEGVGMRGGER